ncbi:MAG: fumarylacetoacetate hydrolase family protein [Thiomonas sp.]|jgi:2-keto-4-pentenoate hydratase/2-oxohepta-3-ene-1,7-dioic acid hydratase in catechol pathway
MKLVRYGRNGHERPGLIDAQGRLRSLAAQVHDIDAGVFGPAGQRWLRRVDPASLPLVPGRPRLGVPFVGISKFIAIGLNYRDHAQEAGMPVPASPIVFTKWTSCISGPYDAVLRPPGASKLDWEVELGVVIGRPARFVREADALKYVAGYCLVNDVSERAYQLEQGSQWNLGKGCDTFGPIGPWLVTRDDIDDPQNVDLWLDVNGERMQQGNTRNMVFGVAYLVAYLSRFMTLLPGDVIATGTPPGVGMGRKPPRYLQPGDEVTLGSPQLGVQRQTIRNAPQRPV